MRGGKRKGSGRKKLYKHRVLIGFDTEMFEWLQRVSREQNRSYSSIIERSLTLVRFGL